MTDMVSSTQIQHAPMLHLLLLNAQHQHAHLTQFGQSTQFRLKPTHKPYQQEPAASLQLSITAWIFGKIWTGMALWQAEQALPPLKDRPSLTCIFMWCGILTHNVHACCLEISHSALLQVLLLTNSALALTTHGIRCQWPSPIRPPPSSRSWTRALLLQHSLSPQATHHHLYCHLLQVKMEDKMALQQLLIQLEQELAIQSMYRSKRQMLIMNMLPPSIKGTTTTTKNHQVYLKLC